MTIRSKDRKAPELGPKIRVETVRVRPDAGNSNLVSIINSDGFRDLNGDGIREHRNDPATMCLVDWATNSFVEFEFPEPTTLANIEIWNYNEEWQTGKGIRSLDIATSIDGTNWSTVLRGAKVPQAYGENVYDDPAVLKLAGMAALKVRFDHIVLWDEKEKQYGLSEVAFHEATGLRAGPMKPQDGDVEVDLKNALEWVSGSSFAEHRVYLGTNANDLPLLQSTRQNRSSTQQLKSDTTYYWRVDELQSDGKVIKGRTARFETVGRTPIAWWNLIEKEGATAADASVNRADGKIKGPLRWLSGTGQKLGGLEFDGIENLIDCGTSSALDFRDGVTVSAWIKVRKFDKAFQAVVTKGDNSWRLQRSGDANKLSFAISGIIPAGSTWMDTATIATKQKVDDDQWHHIVGLYNGQRLALYVDGKLDDSAEASGSIPKSSNPVMIGENAGQKSRLFNGWIRDVRLYNHGLDEEGVKLLYADGLAADKH